MARAVAAQTGKPHGKYIIVRNLGTSTVTIPPDSDERAGKDIVVPAFGAAAVKWSEAWLDDTNLEKMVRLGYVEVSEGDKKPLPIPTRPQVSDMREPRLNQMVTEIVFGDDDKARDFINAEPTFNGTPGEPVNTEWLKGTGWKVLNAALAWLKVWGPPEDKQWRVGAITARLEQIRMMP